MSTKHRPGPWHWDGDVSNYDPLEEAPWLMSPNDFGRVLAGEIKCSNSADARLIAAAPDLLEALKYARRMVRASECDIAFIDSAIAKAEGK